MKYSALILFLIIGCIDSQVRAQFDKPLKLDKKARGNFYPGFIQLNSGVKIEGDLQYHFETGVLYEKDGKKTRPYTATNVSHFEVTHDEKVRKFYSLPYDVFQEGRERFTFFEVLYEKNSIALLSNYSLSYQRMESGNNLNGGEVKVFLKSENIYIVRGAEGIKPFLKSPRFLNTNAWKRNEKIGKEKRSPLKIVNKEFPRIFFGSEYQEIKSFMNENKLQFTKIEDLTKILDYYISVLE